MNPNQERILMVLRNNSRIKFSDIEQQLKIPSSTAYDAFQKMKPVFLKFTTLVDFGLLGYPLRRKIIVSGRREFILDALMKQQGMNSLQLTNKKEVFAEFYFRNLHEEKRVIDLLQEINCEFHIFTVRELFEEKWISTFHPNA